MISAVRITTQISEPDENGDIDDDVAKQWR